MEKDHLISIGCIEKIYKYMEFILSEDHEFTAEEEIIALEVKTIINDAR